VVDMTCCVGRVGIARFLGLVNEREFVRDDFTVRPRSFCSRIWNCPREQFAAKLLSRRMHKPIVYENMSL